MREIPMHSPHPRGQHYTKFTHDSNITLANGQKIVQELNDYRSYNTFKWNFLETPQEGSFQPIPGLSTANGYAEIKTNSLKEFNKGDLIFLKWAACPEGRLYVITEADPLPYIYAPKPRQGFQKLELRKLL